MIPIHWDNQTRQILQVHPTINALCTTFLILQSHPPCGLPPSPHLNLDRSFSTTCNILAVLAVAARLVVLRRRPALVAVSARGPSYGGVAIVRTCCWGGAIRRGG